MSKGYQRVICYGVLGKDPEVKTTAGGKTLASFSVAVNGYKDQVEWFNVQAWEKTAEVARDYLKKGDSVLLEGVMQTRSWDGDKGKQYRTELIVSNLTLLGGKSGKNNDRGQNPEIDDSDLPF